MWIYILQQNRSFHAVFDGIYWQTHRSCSASYKIRGQCLSWIDFNWKDSLCWRGFDISKIYNQWQAKMYTIIARIHNIEICSRADHFYHCAIKMHINPQTLMRGRLNLNCRITTRIGRMQSCVSRFERGPNF